MASAIRNSRVGDFGMDCIPVQERRTFRVALNLNDLNLVPYWAASVTRLKRTRTITWGGLTSM
jgi:hypothetical protein